MICPNCQNELPDGALFCNACGYTATAYAPPEGFVLDPESHRYYRSETTVDGTLWITWFDTSSGTYEQLSYPTAQAGNPNPEIPATTAAYPSHPSAAPENTYAKQARRKKGVLIIAIPIVMLLAGLGLALWQSGTFTASGSDGIPPDIMLIDLDAAELPVLSAYGNDDSLASGHIEDSMEPDPISEQDGDSMEPYLPPETDIEELPISMPEPASELTPEPATPLRSWGEVSITVTASSTLEPSTNYDYYAGNVLDGNNGTAWVEGAAGHGFGEFITISTADGQPAKINSFSIRNGYQRTNDTYTNNSRVQEALLEFSDGSHLRIWLEDIKDWQEISMPDDTETSYIIFTIVSVYPGTRYEDTCISEIAVW